MNLRNPASAGGAPECSPARQRWVLRAREMSAGGATDSAFCRPSGAGVCVASTQRSERVNELALDPSCIVGGQESVHGKFQA